MTTVNKSFVLIIFFCLSNPKVLSELGCSAPCRFPTYGLSLVSSIDAVSEEEDVAILRFYAPVPVK